MANVGYGSTAIAPDPAPGYSSGDQHQHRRGRTKWVVVTAVVVVVLAAASYVSVRAWDSFRQSFANIGSGFANLGKVMESGGTASNAAAGLAAPLPPGFLSLSTLNAKLPSYQWVDGATNVPYTSSQRPIVGISATGTHVVTAVQSGPGLCSFGLTITSNADPLIGQGGLSGQGTYYQATNATPGCVANQAPASSWQLWTAVVAEPPGR
jgi:hypothetical protein